MNISDYMGYKAADKICEHGRRRSYLINWEHLCLNYGDNVEFQRMGKQIYFCPDTEKYLYPDIPPIKTNYRRGNRPILDKIVDEICKGASCDRENVLSIMCFCRDLYKKYDDEQLFYGGTEEELIKKGERLCECLGRLFVALCEVIGIPGRIILFAVGGHITSEVYFENKWCWVDPRVGIFILNEEGKLASVKELCANRDLALNQTDEVKSYIAPMWDKDKILYRYNQIYFNPKEVITFGEYSLTDANQYNFGWKSKKKVDEEDGLKELNIYYKENRNAVFGIESMKLFIRK